MIVSVDLERFLPRLYNELMFEFKDEHTLSHVREVWGRDPRTCRRTVVRWTNPDSRDGMVDVEFGSVDEAMMFVLTYG